MKPGSEGSGAGFPHLQQSGIASRCGSTWTVMRAAHSGKRPQRGERWGRSTERLGFPRRGPIPAHRPCRASLAHLHYARIFSSLNRGEGIPHTAPQRRVKRRVSLCAGRHSTAQPDVFAPLEPGAISDSHSCGGPLKIHAGIPTITSQETRQRAV